MTISCDFVVFVLVSFCCFVHVSGHAALIRPTARGMMWIKGHNSPTNYNYMGLNCGGLKKIRHFDGKCGLCGDAYDEPRDHEIGGKYTTGAISRTYGRDQKIIEVKVLVNAFYEGHFEFRLCTDGPEGLTQECFDRHRLKIKQGRNQGNENIFKLSRAGLITLQLEIPENLSCRRCVLQWKYITAHSLGRDETGKHCRGCGHQETFINCADISIQGWGSVTEPAPDLPPERPPEAAPDSASVVANDFQSLAHADTSQDDSSSQFETQTTDPTPPQFESSTIIPPPPPFETQTSVPHRQPPFIPPPPPPYEFSGNQKIIDKVLTSANEHIHLSKHTSHDNNAQSLKHSDRLAKIGQENTFLHDNMGHKHSSKHTEHFSTVRNEILPDVRKSIIERKPEVKVDKFNGVGIRFSDVPATVEQQPSVGASDDRFPKISSLEQEMNPHSSDHIRQRIRERFEHKLSEQIQQKTTQPVTHQNVSKSIIVNNINKVGGSLNNVKEVANPNSRSKWSASESKINLFRDNLHVDTDNGKSVAKPELTLENKTQILDAIEVNQLKQNLTQANTGTHQVPYEHKLINSAKSDLFALFDKAFNKIVENNLPETTTEPVALSDAQAGMSAYTQTDARHSPVVDKVVTLASAKEASPVESQLSAADRSKLFALLDTTFNRMAGAPTAPDLGQLSGFFPPQQVSLFQELNVSDPKVPAYTHQPHSSTGELAISTEGGTKEERNKNINAGSTIMARSNFKYSNFTDRFKAPLTDMSNLKATKKTSFGTSDNTLLNTINSIDSHRKKNLKDPVPAVEGVSHSLDLQPLHKQKFETEHTVKQVRTNANRQNTNKRIQSVFVPKYDFLSAKSELLSKPEKSVSSADTTTDGNYEINVKHMSHDIHAEKQHSSNSNNSSEIKHKHIPTITSDIRNKPKSQVSEIKQKGDSVPSTDVKQLSLPAEPAVPIDIDKFLIKNVNKNKTDHNHIGKIMEGKDENKNFNLKVNSLSQTKVVPDTTKDTVYQHLEAKHLLSTNPSNIKDLKRKQKLSQSSNAGDLSLKSLNMVVHKSQRSDRNITDAVSGWGTPLSASQVLAKSETINKLLKAQEMVNHAHDNILQSDVKIVSKQSMNGKIGYKQEQVTKTSKTPVILKNNPSLKKEQTLVNIAHDKLPNITSHEFKDLHISSLEKSRSSSLNENLAFEQEPTFKPLHGKPITDNMLYAHEPTKTGNNNYTLNEPTDTFSQTSTSLHPSVTLEQLPPQQDGHERQGGNMDLHGKSPAVVSHSAGHLFAHHHHQTSGGHADKHAVSTQLKKAAVLDHDRNLPQQSPDVHVDTSGPELQGYTRRLHPHDIISHQDHDIHVGTHITKPHPDTPLQPKSRKSKIPSETDIQHTTHGVQNQMSHQPDSIHAHSDHHHPELNTLKARKGFDPIRHSGNHPQSEIAKTGSEHVVHTDNHSPSALTDSFAVQNSRPTHSNDARIPHHVDIHMHTPDMHRQIHDPVRQSGNHPQSEIFKTGSKEIKDRHTHSHSAEPASLSMQQADKGKNLDIPQQTHDHLNMHEHQPKKQRESFNPIHDSGNHPQSALAELRRRNQDNNHRLQTDHILHTIIAQAARANNKRTTMHTLQEPTGHDHGHTDFHHQHLSFNEFKDKSSGISAQLTGKPGPSHSDKSRLRDGWNPLQTSDLDIHAFGHDRHPNNIQPDTFKASHLAPPKTENTAISDIRSNKQRNPVEGQSQEHSRTLPEEEKPSILQTELLKQTPVPHPTPAPNNHWTKSLERTTIDDFVQRLTRRMEKEVNKTVVNGRDTHIKVLPLSKETIIQVLHAIAGNNRPSSTVLSTNANTDLKGPVIDSSALVRIRPRPDVEGSNDVQPAASKTRKVNKVLTLNPTKTQQTTVNDIRTDKSKIGFEQNASEKRTRNKGLRPPQKQVNRQTILDLTSVTANGNHHDLRINVPDRAFKPSLNQRTGEGANKRASAMSQQRGSSSLKTTRSRERSASELSQTNALEKRISSLWQKPQGGNLPGQTFLPLEQAIESFDSQLERDISQQSLREKKRPPVSAAGQNTEQTRTHLREPARLTAIESIHIGELVKTDKTGQNTHVDIDRRLVSGPRQITRSRSSESRQDLTGPPYKWTRGSMTLRGFRGAPFSPRQHFMHRQARLPGDGTRVSHLSSERIPPKRAQRTSHEDLTVQTGDSRTLSRHSPTHERPAVKGAQHSTDFRGHTEWSRSPRRPGNTMVTDHIEEGLSTRSKQSRSSSNFGRSSANTGKRRLDSRPKSLNTVRSNTGKSSRGRANLQIMKPNTIPQGLDTIQRMDVSNIPKENSRMMSVGSQEGAQHVISDSELGHGKEALRTMRRIITQSEERSAARGDPRRRIVVLPLNRKTVSRIFGDIGPRRQRR